MAANAGLARFRLCVSVEGSGETVIQDTRKASRQRDRPGLIQGGNINGSYLEVEAGRNNVAE